MLGIFKGSKHENMKESIPMTAWENEDMEGESSDYESSRKGIKLYKGENNKNANAVHK